MHRAQYPRRDLRILSGRRKAGGAGQWIRTGTRKEQGMTDEEMIDYVACKLPIGERLAQLNVR